MLDTTIDRRRVLQGAMWATPAVVVATAVPAAAASTDPELAPGAGGLVVTSASAVQNVSSVTVTSTVAFSGKSASAPVSGTTLVLSMPSARVGLLEPSTVSAGWSFVGVAVSGASTLFTFKWVGADLGPANSATSPLVATLPKGYADSSAFQVTAHAKGDSAYTPVVSPTVPLAVGAGVAARLGGWVKPTHFTISDLNSGKHEGSFVVGFQYNIYQDTAPFAGSGVETWQAEQAPDFATWAIRWRFQVLDASGKVVDEETGVGSISHNGNYSAGPRTFTTQRPGVHRGRMTVTSDQVATVKGVKFALKSLDVTTEPFTIN